MRRPRAAGRPSRRDAWFSRRFDREREQAPPRGILASGAPSADRVSRIRRGCRRCRRRAGCSGEQLAVLVERVVHLSVQHDDVERGDDLRSVAQVRALGEQLGVARDERLHGDRERGVEQREGRELGVEGEVFGAGPGGDAGSVLSSICSGRRSRAGRRVAASPAALACGSGPGPFLRSAR